MLYSTKWNALLIINPEFEWRHWLKSRKISVRTGDNPAKLESGISQIYLQIVIATLTFSIYYTSLVSSKCSLTFHSNSLSTTTTFSSTKQCLPTCDWLLLLGNTSNPFFDNRFALTLEIVYCFKGLRTAVVADGRCLIHIPGIGGKYDPNRTLVCRGWKLNVFKRVTWK
jgi:hypothetical protein